ncbi:asparagine synthase (glutamine-hydrolyzing) [Helicobacter sp. 23-1044]
MQFTHNFPQSPSNSQNLRYQIVFNGEIYNFIELKEILIAKGYIFRTNSDTEVILASFAEWGEVCLNKFNGAFAFALWDEKEKRLFLARDRFGKKPLFYAFTKDKDGRNLFVFASEMKAIYPYLRDLKPHKDFIKMANINNIFDYESGENRLIDGIKSFPHSHFAYFDGRNLAFRRYYHILDNIKAPPKRYDDAVEQFRELFLDAVKIRMRSDVPIGTALSGGLDSSATICAMAQIARQNPTTRECRDFQHAFVACFDGTALDERVYAKKVTDFLKIKADFLEIKALNFWDKITHYFYMFEDLYLTSPIPMIATYRAVKQSGVSVTLDGHGADELFSGYGHLLNALWDAKFSPKMFLDILQTHNATTSNKLTLFNALKHTAKIAIKQGTGFKKKALFAENHANFKHLDYFSAQLLGIFYESILPTLLRNYDRYSMINGVEIRMPFMDYRLVEFVFSLPYHFKFGGGYTKRLIRDSVSDFMPSEVAWRKSKIGFNSPIVDWLQGDLREWGMDLVHSREFLQCELVENPAQIAHLMEQICSGAENSFSAGERLWCGINPYLWREGLKEAIRF